ncbi:MAG TPA: flagellar assembly protein H, partial [Allocoleopsis sp.]
EGNSQINWEELPYLWIITPTASRQILNFFRVIKDPSKWGEGIYILSEGFRLGIVVVHQLPKTEETLWLRLLGRGKVAKQAMLELKALPEDNEFKSNTLELVYSLLATLQLRQEQKQQIQTEEKELIMRLSPEYLTAIETATQKGVQQGVQLMIESFLLLRFGEIDQQLNAIITPLSEMPPSESTRLLRELSREQLIARFNSDN